MIGTKVILFIPGDGEFPLTLSFECRGPPSFGDDVGLPLGDATRGRGEAGGGWETGKFIVSFVSRDDVVPRTGRLGGTLDTGDCVSGTDDVREDAVPSALSVCAPLRPNASPNVGFGASGAEGG
jgi:hypothetical protein